MVTLSLHGTVILGYVDVSLAGCRTLLGAFDCDNYEVSPWNLNSLQDAKNETSSNLICSCIRANDAGSELLPVAQIYRHKTDDVSLLVINAHVPDSIAHVVANDIINIIANSRNLNEFIVLSSFPTGFGTIAHRIIDRGVVIDSFAKLKCGDPFLNSIIQFALVDNIPISVLVSDGRKVRNRMTPNEADGSMQCIMALSNILKRDLHLDLRLDSISKMIYDGSATDEESNLMFL